jgi:hypothetical protein
VILVVTVLVVSFTHNVGSISSLSLLLFPLFNQLTCWITKLRRNQRKSLDIVCLYYRLRFIFPHYFPSTPLSDHNNHKSQPYSYQHKLFLRSEAICNRRLTIQTVRLRNGYPWVGFRFLQPTHIPKQGWHAP